MVLDIVEVARFRKRYLPFIHDHNFTDHSRNGSLVKHLVIENVFLRIRRLLVRIGDACPLYKLLEAPNNIVFGLNCGFPPRDIASYTAWCLGLFRRNCK